MVDLAGWPCFHFIGIYVVGIGLGEAEGLAIGRAVLTKADIVVGFSGLSLC